MTVDTDLASRWLGGTVMAASDEAFADKENLLKPAAPVFIEGKYTDLGKWMDGWETRRRRTQGLDWCIVRLGLPGIIRGVVVDTNHPLAGMTLEFDVTVVAVRDAPATAGCGNAHEPGHRHEGIGDELAQDAARATLASRARPRKPGSGEAPESPAHGTAGGTGKA